MAGTSGRNGGAQSHGDQPGFFSSTRALSLLPGPHFSAAALDGYAIDLRSKAVEPSFPPPWAAEEPLYVAYTQWGLGAYERYLGGEGEAWLEAARACGEWLLGEQAASGGFEHGRPYPHTFRLDPPWVSGITQGQAGSLFVRLHRVLGDERFAEAAVRALAPLAVPTARGGVLVELDGGPFPEEYPTEPPSFVLNGALFALFGLHDVAAGLDDADLRDRYRRTAETISRSLHRWDTGWWSRYDLFPHRLRNVASGAYHRLHISQLDVLSRISPDLREPPEYRLRFERYQASAASRTRAFAAKATFRLLVPRR